MAYDLEEQEQIDEFKVWWNKNGKMVTTIVTVGLLAYAAWQGYQYWMNQKATDASNLYQALVTTDASKTSEIMSASQKLMDQYSSTPYAGRAAIFAAKTSYIAKDVATTKKNLQWAISNAKESSTKAIATLQLAGVLFEAKDFEGAKKVLTAPIDTGYEGLKDNLTGDILLAQGKNDEAKKAFEKALKNLDPQGKLFQLTKQKFESLGS